MTKLSSKTHIFLIISILLIAIGMAIGTVTHFLSDGFFNYGDEFADYSSVTVSYLMAEQTDEEVDEICTLEFGDLKPFEVNFSKDAQGSPTGEIIYKFSAGTDDSALEKAVNAINAKLSADDGLSVASYHKATTLVGGSRVLVFTSIAIASSVVFEVLYLAVRYRKPGMIITALAAQINNLGVYVALLAATRIPLGVEAIAFAALVVVLTTVTSCVFFDRVKYGFKNDGVTKSTVGDLVDLSAKSTYKANATLCAAAAVIIALLAIFAVIASANFATLATFGVALLAVLACWYGFALFTPALYGGVSKLDVNKAKA